MILLQVLVAGLFSVVHARSTAHAPSRDVEAEAVVTVLPSGAAHLQKRRLFRQDAAAVPAAEAAGSLGAGEGGSALDPAGSDEATSAAVVESRDCRWGQWEVWSACSRSCGMGSLLRMRSKTHKRGNGADCDGLDRERNNCNVEPCPVDCLIAQWNEWGVCSKTCGGPSEPGKKERVRGLQRRAQHGGKPCEDASWESRICNHLLHQSCPRDCRWGDWSSFGDCSVTCGMHGGLSVRSRDIEQQLLHTGQECSGPAFETEVCNKKACPLDCVWHEWQEWSSCSRSCGQGQKRRLRDMKSNQNELGSCSGRSYQLERCHLKPCPQDCQWTSYGDWSSCSVLCGGGLRTKLRRHVPEQFGGKPCQLDDNNVTEPCNMQECEA
eukprot:TRINITY_DN11597_c0_g1_i1.p2 TRINITY_DN11597_c0_g1~~TRINITY_DN11597_c0_g1_i1.p2  ORF type:complete len:380 (-),score=75.99 TRINITY_DN11597_c0_g1_i1:88-1227(-)